MVTIDEVRENLEADEKFWAGLQGMNTEQAEGHKEVAAKSARHAADAEAGAAAAAEKASVAKDRIERLAKGEDASGGLGKPMTREDYEKILRDAGWTAADIRFRRNFIIRFAAMKSLKISCSRVARSCTARTNQAGGKSCARYAPSAAVTHSGGLARSE